MHRIKEQDFWAGVMFIGFGILGFVLSSPLSTGTAADMGPGYVPRLLSLVTILLGAVIAGRSLLAGSEAIEFGDFRPVIFIIAATVGFAILFSVAGLIPAIVVLVGLSSFGGRDFTPPRAVGLSVALTIFCIVVFKYVVGMNLVLLRGVA